MGLVDRLLALMLAAAVVVVGAIALIYQDSVRQVGWVVERFTVRVFDLAYYCLFGLTLFLALLGLTFFGIWIAKQRNENMRQRDGSFALQRLRVRGHTVFVDVNKMMGAAMVIGPQGIQEVFTAAPEVHLQHAIARARVATVQALAPGDTVVGAIKGGGVHGMLNAAAGRFIAGAYDRDRQVKVTQPSPDVPALPGVVERAAPALTLSDAIAQARPDQLIIGQAEESGQLATFNPALHGHGGIVGATGTGKTSGAAFTAVLGAIRAGYHVVILDPEGGSDWGVFRGHAEWVETDRQMLPDQLAALYNEYVRRADGGQHDPLLVVIEEYGDLFRQLRLAAKRTAENVDALMDAILRRGRRRGISVLLVDQYPDEWSQQTIAGVKWRCVYRLGPNQGAKLEEYNVARLPHRGAFRHDGKLYASWNAAPQVRTLLATMPAPMFAPVINSAFVMRSSEEGEGGHTDEQSMNGLANGITNAPTNGVPASTEDWFSWVLAEYLPQHPEILQVDAQGRGMGICLLAKSMATLARGDARQYEDFKGIASEVAKRVRRTAKLP